MNSSRKLAAILAADVVSYSRLIGLDEEGTLQRLRNLRNELIDPAIKQHRGRIIKTMGDGFLVEFASAVDAVRCAIDIQHGAKTHNTDVSEDRRIELRVGINVGDVVVEGDDLLGDGVNIAARLEGIAEAGGICISESAYQQVRDKIDVMFADAGLQTLKNIARPIRAYRLELDATQPKVMALQLPNMPSIAVLAFENLSGDPVSAPGGGRVPAALNSLIGRADAVQETLQLLKTTRCLTFTGAGGSGKTRLALELAGLLHEQYAGCVWWVELASVRDPQLLLATIARAMGVSDPGKPALQSVMERLQASPSLLVLDNCEHLIEDCADLAVKLLRALPLLQLLATSRESLRIAGEFAWVVPPLELPSAGWAARAADDLTRVASVQLLIERIRQKNGKFALTNHNAPSLVQICRGLEGLPLALELVAGQVGVQTLEHIAAGLDNSLRLLTGGHRGDMQHHQTMHAAVQWSYDLLSAVEQTLFTRLSTFAGGWTLDGAQAVCTGLDFAAQEVPELLARLERSSMVLAYETDGAIRFRMLEPIRQFAYSQLESLGLADSTRQQLLAWYVNRCDAIVPELGGSSQAKGYKTLAAEIDNLRAVLTWSKHANLEQGLYLAASLWRFWQVKGYAKELLDWFEETLPLAQGASISVQANAYNSAGIMARTCGLYAEATRLHGVALILRRDQGERRGEAIALNNLAVVARDQGDLSMVEHYCRESMSIAREIGDKNLEGLGLMHLGTALRGQDQASAAEETFRQSFSIFSELGDKRVLANLHNCLGELAQAKADWAEAQRCYEASLELNEELDDFWGLALSTCNLASLRYDLQDFAGALTRLLQSFSHYRRAGAKPGLEVCFELLAQIAQQRGLYRRAAWCWGVVEQIEKETGTVTTSANRARRDGTLRHLATLMVGQSFLDARSAGRQVSIEQAFSAVFSDPDLAQEPARPGLSLVASGRA